MLIFIPMSGFGDRYIRAGYTQPKPLIPVDGVPMIERILQLFPADARFLFGINRQHAESTELASVLARLRPTATIVVIEPHKDGPIQTVLSCAEHIPDDEDVLLNYCDFGVDWSFGDFEAWLTAGAWDGAMTAYKGFHPHSLGPTLYAYMKSEGDRVTEIREKHHFTPDKFEEYASSGLYYFRRGRDLKRIAQELVDAGARVNGEFYVSMAMQSLIAQGGKVGVYPLAHFYQWGTPEDLRDYDSWAKAMTGLDAFLSRARHTQSRAVQVIPMAGRGQRFVDQGYADPKPLIDVGGRPMIAQAMASLPSPTDRVLIALHEHAENKRFQAEVAALKAPTRVLELDRVTEGQACTAKLGLDGIDLDRPILFAPCDTGYTYDLDRWLTIEGADDADLVVWSARDHLPARWRPQMYGWLVVDGERISHVAVKKQVDGFPADTQEVVTGTFWFRSARVFLEQFEAMVAANDRVNGEFYIDTIVRRMVEAKGEVKAFTVTKYMPWGTPEELKTFNYWNEVFRGGRSIPESP
ncbi:MAG: NTP transferase domain-containing protein [Polyangiaceae bacterium]